MKSIFVFFAFILFFSSCKKETTSSQTEPQPIDIDKVFPNYVHSDSAGEDFIQGIFNGKKICMSPTQPPSDAFFNAYYLDETIDLDQLNLIRANSEGSAEMQIYFGKSEMLTRPIPYNLPHENLAQCEFTQFQFYDTWHRHGTENDQFDDYTYQASTNTGMKLTVTDFTNDIMEGTFEGILRTNTGKIMTVTDGSFKIKIFVIVTGN